jgi:virginiamycin B lyase
VWFTEFDVPGNAIGRMRPDGFLLNEYPIPTPNAGAEGLTVGPDGNVWFAEFNASKIGVVMADGTVHDFPTTTAAAGPTNVISGPGGELWFTESKVNKIGRMTTAGAPDGEFSATTASSHPFDLAMGPDGNIWFTERDASKIGVMSPAGAMMHEYDTTTPSAKPFGIVRGPDGNMWFAEDKAIGRITMSGTVAEFPTPTANPGNVYLTVGPDQKVWFAEDDIAQLGFIDPSTGAIIDFPVPTAHSFPYGIAAGPDCNVWFAEIGDSPAGNRLGRVDLGGCPKPLPAPPGAPLSGSAKVRIASHTITIDTRTGRGTWPVSCQNVAADQCRIALSLKIKKLTAARGKLVSIGGAKGTIAGGKRGKLKVKLTRKGRTLLANKKRLKVTASGTSRNRAGSPVPLKTSLTLKAKRR